MNPTTKLHPILSALALILALGFWVTYCHDPSVRAGQRLRDSTTVVDAHRHQTDVRVARMAAESSLLVGQLRRFARNDSVARGEIARLRSVIKPAETVDSTPELRIQLAVRDTLIAEQAAVIMAQDSELTIWRAMVAARDSIIPSLIAERDAYRRIAIAWQQKAEPGFLTKAVRAIPYIAVGFVAAEILQH